MFLRQLCSSRSLLLLLAGALVLFGLTGCMSDAEHDRMALELHRAQAESAQRASEIASLRQMLLYYTSSQPAAQNQIAMNQLWRAYSDLVARHGALAADVEILKRRDDERHEADRRRQDDALIPTTRIPANAPQKKSSSDKPVDLFMYR